MLVIIIIYTLVFSSAVSCNTVYKQRCRTTSPIMAPLKGPVETDINSDQNDNQLNCGYCNIHCVAPAGLVKHCKGDRHKYAVFADYERDVLWQFEPPPVGKDKISTTLHR